MSARPLRAPLLGVCAVLGALLAIMVSSSGLVFAQPLAPAAEQQTTEQQTTEQQSQAQRSGAPADQLPEPPTVSIVTIAPGPIYWERFGHIALLLRDPRTGQEFAFNYGIFDFSEANFMVNFARGLMRYRMSVDRWPDLVASARQEGRWVVEQPLNLDVEQRAALAGFLEWNLRPENSRYPYDYFKSNCATRVRDALDKAVGGQLRAQLQALPGAASYRQQVVYWMAPEWPLALGMDLGLGPLVDAPLNLWDESFIPMALRLALPKVTLRDAQGQTRPLVQGERVWANAPGLAPGDEVSVDALSVRPPNWAPWLTLAGIVWALLIAMTQQWAVARSAAGKGIGAAHVLAGLLWTATTALLGVGGVVLLGMWLGTEHWGAWRNWNLLLLNPLLLLLLPGAFGVRWSLKLARPLALLAGSIVLVKLVTRVPILAPFDQQNWGWIGLFVPLHIALALSASLRLRQSFGIARAA